MVGYIDTKNGTLFTDKDLTSPVSDPAVMELAIKKLEKLQTMIDELLKKEKTTTEAIDEAALAERMKRMAIRKEEEVPKNVVVSSGLPSSPLSHKKSNVIK